MHCDSAVFYREYFSTVKPRVWVELGMWRHQTFREYDCPHLE